MRKRMKESKRDEASKIARKKSVCSNEANDCHRPYEKPEGAKMNAGEKKKKKNKEGRLSMRRRVL